MSQATFPAFAAYGAASPYYPIVTEPDRHAFRHLQTTPQLDPYHHSPAARSANSVPRHGFLDRAVSRLEPALRFEPHDVPFHQEQDSLVNHAFPPHHHLHQRQSFPLSGASDEVFADPIARFYRNADGPWSSVQATTIEPAGLAPALAPDASQPDLRFRAPSDVSGVSETSALGRSAAMALADGSSRDGGVAREVRIVEGDGSRAAACRECDGAALGKDENAVVSPTTMGRKSRTKLFHCRTCHRNFKCASDLKKDRRKHCKPFTCSVPGCARGKNLGFTTVNDLNRHKKSVHPEEMMAIHNNTSSSITSTSSTNIAATTTMTATAATRSAAAPSMTPSFRCVGPGCTRSGKIWPRRDNFKQHVRRVHGVGERDVAEIVRRSLYYPDGSAPADETSRSQMAGEIQSAMTQKNGRRVNRKSRRSTAQGQDEDACSCASGPADGISTSAKQCTSGADSLPGLRAAGGGGGCDIVDESFALLLLPFMADGQDGEDSGRAGMHLDLSFHYRPSRPTQSPTAR